MLKPISRILNSLLLLVFIGAWGNILYHVKSAPRPAPMTTIDLVPTAVRVPTSPVVPTSTVIPTPQTVHNLAATVEAGIPDGKWSQVQPGLERRVIPIYNSQNQQVESMYVWRLDQKYFRLDVAFAERPKTLETWQAETNAAMVVNGGYFSINNERYSADGLSIINGQASGRSFNGYGGMLAVDQFGAEVRWLVQEPYNASEPLHAALQAFPILVQPGGELGFPASRENYARARRTVIAQDRDGRIFLIVTPDGYFTLHQLSLYLTESDLDLDVALNLDGGGSTGILVANPREIIAPRVLLPFVVLVHTR
ncbi:MAG TPA: phosphodiester glycosidase family protein [Anaerolineales bacterium]|nr:phosphodiester glycosidase family protein [Anaerolineales bacterium]